MFFDHTTHVYDNEENWKIGAKNKQWIGEKQRTKYKGKKNSLYRKSSRARSNKFITYFLSSRVLEPLTSSSNQVSHMAICKQKKRNEKEKKKEKRKRRKKREKEERKKKKFHKVEPKKKKKIETKPNSKQKLNPQYNGYITNNFLHIKYPLGTWHQNSEIKF